MEHELEEFEDEAEEEYTLKELIEPEDLEYLQKSLHPSKVGIYIRKWVAQEKREQALKANPPAPYEEEALTPTALAKTVQESREKIARGDYSLIEGQLISQSIALQRIFEIYTQRMINEKYFVAQGTYGQIALKAQNQSRKTLSTIAELRNPKKLTFIRQQNNAQFNLNQKKNSKQTFGDQT